MTLVAKWLEIQTERGGTQVDAMRELNAHFGLNLTPGDLYRWRIGERYPRHWEVRKFMLREVVPYVRKKRMTIAATVEALL